MTASRSTAILLDSHALVWLLDGSPRLGTASRQLIGDAASRDGAWVAAISAWEIAMLVGKGRLALARDVDDWLAAAFALPGLRLAPLEPTISVASTRLPGELHGDPADRMIVATARHHAATLITEDRRLLDYGAAGHVKARQASA